MTKTNDTTGRVPNGGYPDEHYLALKREREREGKQTRAYLLREEPREVACFSWPEGQPCPFAAPAEYLRRIV